LFKIAGNNVTNINTIRARPFYIKFPLLTVRALINSVVYVGIDSEHDSGRLSTTNFIS